MSYPELTPDQIAKRRGNIIGWIAFAVVAFVVSPFIIATIQGMLGLIVVGVIASAAMKFLPILERMAANWRLKALKAEAARNPVETLQNNYQSRAEALAKRREGLIAFKAGVRSYSGQVDMFKRRWPADGPKYDAILVQLQATAVKFEAKFNENLKGLQDFALQIEKVEAEWNLGNTLAQARGVALTQGDFDDLVSTKTAISAVQLNLDRGLSDLDDIDLTIPMPSPANPDTPALPAASGSVIDVAVDKVATKARVR